MAEATGIFVEWRHGQEDQSPGTAETESTKERVVGLQLGKEHRGIKIR